MFQPSFASHRMGFGPQRIKTKWQRFLEKAKEVATVTFALLMMLAVVIGWVLLETDRLNECTGRGHSVGFCMRAKSIDTGR